jgi:exosortase
VSTVISAQPAVVDYTTLLPGEEAEKPLLGGLTASAWVKILVVTGLLVALFRFSLARLWLKTNPFTGSADWGHTTIIPLIGLYYLYLNRDRLLAAKVKPILFEGFTRTRLMIAGGATVVGLLLALGTKLVVDVGASEPASFVVMFGIAIGVLGVLVLLLGWGLGNLLFGLLVFAIGIYPVQNDWLTDYGMVHTIFGTVLTLCGWDVMRVVWFPIAFLVCGLPWPGLVYSKIALPLQHLAANVAVKMLNFTGIDAMGSGTKIYFTGSKEIRALNVAEACAGMRSLMTFISVGAAVAFLSNRAFWQKVVITASAIPIAIFCNVMRVTGQAYLDRLAGEQWSESFAHQFVGLVMLIPAFLLILLVAWVIDHVFLEEVDDKAKYKVAAAKRAVVIPAAVSGGGVAKTQTAQTASPAAAGLAAAPTMTTTTPPPARVPPRQNLTGKPAPRTDGSVEGV